MTGCHCLPWWAFSTPRGFPVNVTPGICSAPKWPQRAEGWTPKGKLLWKNGKWEAMWNCYPFSMVPRQESRGAVYILLRAIFLWTKQPFTLSNSPSWYHIFTLSPPISPTSLILFLSLILSNYTSSNNNNKQGFFGVKFSLRYWF